MLCLFFLFFVIVISSFITQKLLFALSNASTIKSIYSENCIYNLFVYASFFHLFSYFAPFLPVRLAHVFAYVVVMVVVVVVVVVDSEVYFVDAHVHCVDPLYAAQVTITHECRAYVNHYF